MSVFVPPHLEHRPQRSGLPVPWVVADSPRGRSALVPSVWAQADLMTVWEADGYAPDFGRYDDQRLRESMHGRLCHVCSGLPRDPLVCCPSWPDRRSVGGVAMTLLAQPWVCAPCLAYACRTCGPLSKAILEGRGWVFAALEDAALVATYWQPVNPEDPVPPKGSTVLSGFKIAIDRVGFGPGGFGCQGLAGWDLRVGAKHWRRWGVEAPPLAG